MGYINQYSLREQEHIRAQLRGAGNRKAGDEFEKLIGAACAYYKTTGAAEIEKTPEPVKQLSKMDGTHRFTACYEKRAQPDFKGTLKGGRSVVFEAKHTSTDRIMRNAVTPEQHSALERHQTLGALCFVLVEMGTGNVYSVPWDVWTSMKEKFGHLYMNEVELTPFKVRRNANGVFDFLKNFKEAL